MNGYLCVNATQNKGNTMTQTALILGATGRFGRNTATAFETAGWAVRRFDRSKDSLEDAAKGVDVIVSGWNPEYTDWAEQVPKLHAQVIKAALANDVTVILPGNVYVFGEATAAPWSEVTAHRAENPLGRIRIDMEKAYRDSGVQTILLRAGDYLDTEASGNWFDEIMTTKLHKGKFIYPGALDRKHAFAYLPDVARAAVRLAEMRADLPQYIDVPFQGYTLTGRDLAAAVQAASGYPVKAKSMNWLPLHIAKLFWPLGRKLIEMQYLWNTPHCLDGSKMNSLLPDFKHTPLVQALKTALPQ
jgi:nucleoside-diphosphate-sugar epimerase